MPKVVLSGYFGFGNAGDEAILAATVAALRRVVPAVEITVLSGNPAETAAAYGVAAVERGNLSAVRQALRQADLLVSGGGSLLQDVTSNRSIPYYLGIVALAKVYGKKVMLYGNGVGPVRGRLNRLLVRCLGNLVDQITVRDAGSAAVLAELGVTRPPIEVTADAVFTLAPAGREAAEAVLARAGVPAGRPRLGISVRPWQRLEGYKAALARAAELFAAAEGVEVVFLPMQHPGDLEVSREVAALMRRPAWVVAERCAVPTVMALYGAMDLVLGMRLHALIFAALQGVPHLGVVYDPKVASFLQIAGQPVAGTVEDLDPEQAAAALTRVWREHEATRAHLLEVSTALAQRAWRNAELAAALLRGEGRA
ncbi:MAG TPA: polysaccharide pyruvyl transferase CsaB [Firmicutes bacterium]|jgi:polysaccharide pyruvyl transferase CsaB|nr:polysaccharide pyruvyl transferase CsaB [Bacillota bacterium]